MSELEKFKQRVEKHIKKHALTPTKFGVLFAGDPNFVFSLREGREPRTSTREKVEAAMTATKRKGGVAA